LDKRAKADKMDGMTSGVSPQGSDGEFAALRPSQTVPPDLPLESVATYDSARSIAGFASHRRAQPDTDEMSFSSVGGLSRWTVAGGLPDPRSLTDQSPAPADDAAYTLVKILGRGGMGEVWEARQQSLSRRIAVKRVLPDNLREFGQLAAENQFRQEALITAQIEHPNVVPVHDLGVDDKGNLLLAMKLVQGRPWDKILAEDFKTLGETDLLIKHLPILRATTQALVFAHDRGVVHRDIKPSQVMVGNYGEVLLMDWGLAILHQKSPALDSASGAVALPTCHTGSSPSGTPALMAPEQTLPSAEYVGPWTDVYLLGGTLYFLLTGSYPHTASSSRQSFLRATLGEIDPPAERAPKRRLPSDLVALCMKALAPAPPDRHKSAGAFLDALDDYMTGSSRRREANAILAEATQRFDQGAPTYDALAAIAGRLDHASKLYGDHPDLPALRDRLAVDYVRVALAARDLSLASVHASHVADETTRANLTREIAVATAARDLQERQRRAFMAAAAILLVVAALGATLVVQQRERASKAEAAQALAQQSADHERAQNSLIREMVSLLNDEASLGTSLTNRFPPPLIVKPENRRISSSNGWDEDAQALMAQRRKLAQRRDELERRSPGALGAAPAALVDAESYWLLHTGENLSDFERAKSLLERSVAQRPNDVEAVASLGVALAYCGQDESARDHLTRALELERASASPRPRVLASYSLALAELLYLREDVRVRSRELANEALAVFEPDAARSLSEVARVRLTIGPYDKGQRATELGLELLEDHKRNEMDLIRTLRGQMPVFLGFQGKYREAIAGIEQQLEEYRMGGDESVRASFMWRNNLASLYRDMGEHNKAVEIMDELMVDMNELDATDSMDYHRMRMHHARCLILVGRHDEAIQIYEQELRDEKSDEWHTPIELAHGLTGYAQVLGEYQRFDEAIPLAHEGIRRLIDLLGAGDLAVFRARTAVGSILLYSGRYDEAIELTETAFRDRPEEQQKNTDDYWILLNNYATMLSASRRQREALEAFDRLLESVGFDEATGAHADNVSPPLTMLSNWLHIATLAQHEDKEQIRRRLAIYFSWLEKSNPTPSQLFSAANVEAIVCKYLEETDRAIAAYRRAIGYRDQLSDRALREIGLAHADLARLLGEQGRYEESRAEHIIAIDLFRKNNHPVEVAGATTIMARLYIHEVEWRMEQGESLADMRPLLEEGLKILEPYRADLSACPLSQAVEVLGQILLMLGRAEEARPAIEELRRREYSLELLHETATTYSPAALPLISDDATTATVEAAP